jgi:hypothetical protein
MLCATSVLLFLGHCFPVASIVRVGSARQGGLHDSAGRELSTGWGERPYFCTNGRITPHFNWNCHPLSDVVVG